MEFGRLLSVRRSQTRGKEGWKNLGRCPAYSRRKSERSGELKAFYDIYPEKFNNKTNGITFRRWLMHCNHPLTDYITSLIGDEFKTNATALENLLKYKDDEAVLNKLLEIKTEAKKTCKEFILSNTGVEINENSIYDIQIKRLHEYKRQQLNALYIISKYLEIKGGKKPSQPVTLLP